jgi:hypothetical protein
MPRRPYTLLYGAKRRAAPLVYTPRDDRPRLPDATLPAWEALLWAHGLGIDEAEALEDWCEVRGIDVGEASREGLEEIWEAWHADL